jgi:SAM-dependent methyltransferase
MSSLEFTGERIVPGKTAESLFRESQMRYAFAGRYAKGRVVLDVACGIGIGTHCLLKAGGVRCIGLDLSLEAIRYAKFSYAGCTFAACDATSLCLADQSVDLVVSFETIEHLTDPRTFLAQCKRVLRPNGLLICSTPNREISQWGPGNPFHVAEMKPGELLTLMQGYFVDCKLYGQHDVGYPSCVAKSIAVKLLDRTHLRTVVRRSVRRFKPLPLSGICTETEFPEQDGRFPELAINPYISKWQERPVYLLAIGRKPTPASL